MSKKLRGTEGKSRLPDFRGPISMQFRLVIGLLFVAVVVKLTPARADDVLECATDQQIAIAGRPPSRLPNVNLAIKRNFMGQPKELVVEMSDRSDHYVIEHMSDVYYLAADLKSSGAFDTLELNRISGELVLTNRVSKAALPILIERCDNHVSDEQCAERMKTIESGNIFACFSPEERRCAPWRNGSNVLAQFTYHCLTAKRRF